MRVAFLTLTAYDMLTGSDDGDVGGAQLQQILVGRELSRRGHEVVFIEKDRPDKQPGAYDGIEVVLAATYDIESPVLRAGLRFQNIFRVLRRVDPDVCYARVLLFEVLPVATFCHLTETSFVYGFAHDSELTNNPVVFESGLSRTAAYRRAMDAALESADTLVAQNTFQYEQANEKYDPSVVQIPNGYPLAEKDSTNVLRKIDNPIVLWVSTLRPWKRPEMVLELADAIPNATFVIVGGPDDEEPDLYKDVETEAEKRENVRFEGFIPHNKIGSYYTAADVFLNTSEDEGFPNTFLEAWAHQTPVASLSVNPSNILTEYDVGIYGDGALTEFTEQLKSLINNGERRTTMAASAYSYFRENHSIGRIADKYEEVFERILCE